MLGGLGVGAREQEAPVGELRTGDPDLGSVDDPSVVRMPGRGCPAPARSEPAPGSEYSWQASSSQRRKDRTKRRCWSGVPQARTVGATRLTVIRRSSWSAGVA